MITVLKGGGHRRVLETYGDVSFTATRQMYSAVFTVGFTFSCVKKCTAGEYCEGY